MRRLLAAAGVAFAAALVTALTASACGGLVAPNGAVRLDRAATLVAWHDGVEHYMTSFTYQGDVDNLGWIVPLPAVPDSIQEGGAWTLQRLLRETRPQLKEFDAAAGAAELRAAAPVEVLQHTRVEALDITVIRGSGTAVADWCARNGFLLPPETRAHILMYAARSPVFMAARYDVSAVRARHQLSGDGAPVLITMRTPSLWVPLEVLANPGDPVDADLYLLTDDRPTVATLDGSGIPLQLGASLPGAPGFVLRYQEPMNAVLHRDLSSDRNMGWVRGDGWLTYLALDAPGTAVTYDMSLTRQAVMRLDTLGAGPAAVTDPLEPRFAATPLPVDGATAWWLPLLTGGGCLVLVAALIGGLELAHRRG